ncbi:MAG: Wzz/FepE/Etk N-terminal domain-containing protein [Balneolaceae bacterium]|nr:Wzz/FepE/Etk N-terminal domain-containing protein [Balneolaceae bacterium]
MSDDAQLSGNKLTESKSESNLKFQSLDIIEIDLIEKANAVWNGRRTILIFMALCLALAYFHSEYGPTEYTSTASLIQESEGASVGDFGSSFLRSLTGFNFPTGGGSGNMSAVATGRAPLPVSLYPVIVSSTEFQKELIYTELEFSTLDSTLTIFDYFHDHKESALRDRVYGLVSKMTVYLPVTVFDWVKSILKRTKNAITGLWEEEPEEEPVARQETEIIQDDRLQSVTSDERSVIEWLRLRISLASSGGIMQITTTLPDPKAAALVNAKLVEYIQEYITEYRIQKAQQNLENTLERYEEAKERYEEAQYELAQYRDENINVSTQTASLEENRLQNEASLRGSIYNSVAQEVEQARMVMQQQMPVFNPLEKPNVPSSPSSGSSPLLLVFASVFGLFTGILWVLIRSSSLFKS